MGPRATVRAPNSEKRLRGEFLGLAPTLTRISRKSVTPNATWVVDLVHFLVQPLLNRRLTIDSEFKAALRSDSMTPMSDLAEVMSTPSPSSSPKPGFSSPRWVPC